MGFGACRVGDTPFLATCYSNTIPLLPLQHWYVGWGGKDSIGFRGRWHPCDIRQRGSCTWLTLHTYEPTCRVFSLMLVHSSAKYYSVVSRGTAAPQRQPVSSFPDTFHSRGVSLVSLLNPTLHQWCLLHACSMFEKWVSARWWRTSGRHCGDETLRATPPLIPGNHV